MRRSQGGGLGREDGGVRMGVGRCGAACEGGAGRHRSAAVPGGASVGVRLALWRTEVLAVGRFGGGCLGAWPCLRRQTRPTYGQSAAWCGRYEGHDVPSGGVAHQGRAGRCGAFCFVRSAAASECRAPGGASVGVRLALWRTEVLAVGRFGGGGLGAWPCLRRQTRPTYGQSAHSSLKLRRARCALRGRGASRQGWEVRGVLFCARAECCGIGVPRSQGAAPLAECEGRKKPPKCGGAFCRRCW